MLTNEEKLKDLRNLLVLNPDDPIDDYLTPADMIDFIDELLTLRSIRDAGDEEVEKLRHTIADLGPSLAGEADRLRDIAISRGQQLREDRAEIERLKEEMETLVSEAEERANERGRQIATLTADNAALLKQWNDLDLRNEQRHREWNERILTLTAERDEAREEIEMYEAMKEGFTVRATDLESRIRSLTTELAALRSAPGMEDVDECFQNYNGNYTRNQMCDVPKLESIARQAITSRDEVVGLLKWLHGLDITLDDGVHPVVGFADSRFADSAAYADDHKNAKRILEIVEGK